MKQRENQRLLEQLIALQDAPGNPANPKTAAQISALEKTISDLSTPTHIVVAGMEQSGQYALADLILGAGLFRTINEAKTCPRITIRHGVTPMSYALRGNNRMSFTGLSIETALAGSGPDSVEIEMPNAELLDFDLTILPPYEGDGCRTGVLVDLLQRAQIVIWCSDAARLWLPDEQAICSAMPDAVRENSILALTGTDSVTSKEAQQVLDEKQASLADVFRHVCPISVLAAKTAAPCGSVRDEMAFASSGAQSLLCKIRAHVALNREPLLETARSFLPPPVSTPPPVEVKVKPATPAIVVPDTADTDSAVPTEGMRVILLDGAHECILLTADEEAPDLPKLFDAMDGMLSNILTLLRADLRLDRDHDTILEQLEESCELVGLLSFDEADSAAIEAADILHQITADIWFRLPPLAEQQSAESERVTATA